MNKALWSRIFICLFILVFEIFLKYIKAQNCVLGQDYFWKADTMNNRDSATYYLALARPFLQQCQSWETLLNSYNVEFHYYYNANNFGKAKIALEKGAKVLEKMDKKLMAQVFYLNNRGLLEMWQENNLQAFNEFKEALTLFEEVENPYTNFLFILYNNLGVIFKVLEDNKSSSFYYQKALNLIENKEVYSKDYLSENNKLREAKLLGNIAQNQSANKNYSASIKTLKKALDKIKPPFWNKGQALQYGDFMISLGVNYRYLEQFDSANFYIDLAKLLIQSKIQKGDFLRMEGWKNLEEKQYLQAIENYSASKDIFKEIFSSKSPKVAENYKQIAICYANLKQFKESINFCQKAINSLTNASFIESNLHYLPNPETVLSKVHLIDILKEKCKILLHFSETTEGILTNLQIALHHYHYITQLADQLRQNYQTEEAKIFLSAESNKYFEKAIETAKTLFELTGDEKYLEDAFFFSEKSKAVVLLDEIKLKELEGQSILPDSILDRQYEIRAAHNLLEMLLKEEKSKEIQNEELIDSLQNELFDLVQNRTKLRDLVKENYPVYQDLTLTKPISIKGIQENLLKENQQFLEYFVGKNQIFLFVIDKKSIELFQIPNDFDLVKNIEQLLTNKQLFESGFADIAFQLFQKLLPKEFPKNTQLIIVPDAELSFLPFEMLLTENGNETIPKTMPWLLRKHPCQYVYSASILALQNKPNNSTASILAFAPNFKNMPNELRFSEEELSVFSNWQHSKFLDDNASLINFKNNAANFGVLHFSTHATASDSVLNQPVIQLADGKLRLADIYSMRLNAQMAVLSACETGIGNIEKGEGMMSLSRGFSYAGVPSLVTTLWAVNDKATANIIQNYYRELEKGNNKMIALQKAKLDYLEHTSDAAAAPYFWAAPILIGNTLPITFEPHSNYLKIVFALGVIIVGLLIFYGLKELLKPTK